MQTIPFHATVGDDGMLRLELPFGMRGQSIEGVVVAQAQPNGNGSNGAPPAWVDALYGSIQDDTFVEPEELPYEVREPID